MSALHAAALVDDLYRAAITAPASLDDSYLAEWMEQAAEAAAYDRAQMAPLRAAVRLARKMARRLGDTPGRYPDWKIGVDDLVGSRGWEPQLDLVKRGLLLDDSPEVVAAMRERHRAVHFTEWDPGDATTR